MSAISTTTTSTTRPQPEYLFHWASLYIERGWSVIPVDGKRAAVPWKEFQETRPTLELVREWFGGVRPRYSGIAIVTGAVSNLVVVDCDSFHEATFWEKSFPVTPLSVRTGNGAHFYYRYPARDVRNHVKVLSRDIDIRSDAGYVVAPPSVHASGVVYKWDGLDSDYSLTAIPVFKPAWIQARPSESGPTLRTTHTSAANSSAPCGDMTRQRIVNYLSKIQAVESQGGDTTTFRVACKLRDFGLSPETALALMLRWNATNAIPPWSQCALESKIRSAYSRPPRGAT